MKNTKNYLLILPFLLVTLQFCKKEDKPYEPVKVCDNLSNDKNVIDQYLLGNWEWLQDKSYAWSPEPIYTTPKTAGFSETVTITNDQMKFVRVNRTGVETTIFNCKVVREGELTNMSSDSAWTLAIYDVANNNLLNWWRLQTCSSHMILQNAYRGELYPDRTYKKK